MLKIKKINKRLGVALGAALAGVIIPVSGAWAYGPERATFTSANPASYVTFNSITDNPKIGDERNFVRIREVGTNNFVGDKINIVPGKEYEVWTYYHNNASSVLNDKEHSYRGIAVDARLRATLPATIKKGQTQRVLSEISAKNSKPLKVWDEVFLNSPTTDVALRYIQGSAVITSNGKVNGRNLPGAELFSDSGVYLGFDNLNGLLPGCTEYAGSVTYRFKADFADFETSKTVSAHGKNNWVKSQQVGENEKVDFKITYKNTGTVYQNNVNIKDILPAGMSLVKGTTKLFTPSNPNGKTLSDNVASAGINIGDYSMGAYATLTFTAQIDSSKLVCGRNEFTNQSQAITANGGKSDTAKVVVQKNCTPKEEQDKCKIPGKGNLKKDDKDCYEQCKVPGKENLKKDDKNCSENCKVKGKESLKADDKNCSDQCKIKGFEHLKADDKNCAEIPTELPKTGPAEAAMMIIAIMAITGAVAYYFRSREEMKKATANVAPKAKAVSKTEKVEVPKASHKTDKK